MEFDGSIIKLSLEEMESSGFPEIISMPEDYPALARRVVAQNVQIADMKQDGEKSVYEYERRNANATIMMERIAKVSCDWTVNRLEQFLNG